MAHPPVVREPDLAPDRFVVVHAPKAARTGTATDGTGAVPVDKRQLHSRWLRFGPKPHLPGHIPCRLGPIDSHVDPRTRHTRHLYNKPAASIARYVCAVAPSSPLRSRRRTVATSTTTTSTSSSSSSCCLPAGTQSRAMAAYAGWVLL